MPQPTRDQGAINSEFEEFQNAASDALARLRTEIENQQAGSGPATGYAPIRQILDTLRVQHWIDKGGMDARSFDSFLEHYLRYSVKFHHPGYIAHQVSVPGFPGALAALVNGFTNNPMAIFEMGAGAASLEFAVINWMLGKVGWPLQPLPGGDQRDHAGGVLTHGGSLGNLTALLAARARVAPDAWQQGVPDDLAVMVPPVSHYSVDRAVSILGLGSDSIYQLPGNSLGVIDADGLAGTLQKVRADGRRCMALVANACATATGLHDPLRKVGEFCNEHDIWFHVDACHGATALIAPGSRKYLDGIELADSLVWDTHKMMQVPVLCAAVLLRDVMGFSYAFQQEANYLPIGDDEERYSPMPRAVECTKAALSLKVFLTLAWWGEARLGAYVDDRYAAARCFYEIIRHRPGFECPYAPESNILCFRYGSDDKLQDAIRERLLREGSFHITTATVAGKRYLRLTVMSPQTEARTIEQLLDAIERVAGTG